MGEISLPTDTLRSAAQKIIADTNTLSDETAAHWSQIRSHASELPWLISEVLNGFFMPVQQNFTQILTLRKDIGQKLSQAADMADTLENYIASSF